MKILTICPTYKRPELCKRMLNSWHMTVTENNTMVLGLDISDPYIALYPKECNKILCKPKSTVTEVINSIWVQYPEYDYYHITNDDVIYKTIGWDSKLSFILEEYGGGIAYGNDLFQGEALSTFPFISSKIINSVRWLQLPSLNRYCGDTVWHDIGKSCGCLYYLGAVYIEHMHKLAGKGDNDIDIKIFQDDWHSYIKWVKESSKFDIQRVKEVLNG